VVAICSFTLVVAGELKVFSPKLGTSALRETLANTCRTG
jgi:hypothetical protein